MTLRAGWKTLTGKRPNNEDNFYADPERRFFLVADGMGGQSAGERASAMALEIICKRLEKVDFDAATPEAAVHAIDEAIALANSEILALGELDAKLHNMGTTVTFLVKAAGTLYVGGVGDSRTYLLRDGALQQLTTDHSLVQALIEAGTITPEEATTHRYRNVLYRYLGEKNGGAATNPRQLAPQSGDRFLLCSDGVTGGLSDEQLRDLLGAAEDPQAAADAVVQGAYDNGSQDNITAVVVFVG